MAKQSYEILNRLDFGIPTKPNGELMEDNREVKGVYEPTPEGEPNPTVSLDEEIAAPLLEAGAIKPAGTEGFHATDNPEEHGYEGQAQREKAQKQETKEQTASGSKKK